MCAMNLGYACLNITLAEKGITTNKGMVKRTYEAKGIQYASQLTLHNEKPCIKFYNGIQNTMFLFAGKQNERTIAGEVPGKISCIK
jgi:UV DNA damage endonuclease